MPTCVDVNSRKVGAPAGVGGAVSEPRGQDILTELGGPATTNPFPWVWVPTCVDVNLSRVSTKHPVVTRCVDVNFGQNLALTVLCVPYSSWIY